MQKKKENLIFFFFETLKAFSEFVEFVARIAGEGMKQPNYHIIFPTPFSKVLAILTVWGVADLKKLEEVRIIRTEEAY